MVTGCWASQSICRSGWWRRSSVGDGHVAPGVAEADRRRQVQRPLRSAGRAHPRAAVVGSQGRLLHRNAPISCRAEGCRIVRVGSVVRPNQCDRDPAKPSSVAVSLEVRPPGHTVPASVDRPRRRRRQRPSDVASNVARVSVSSAAAAPWSPPTPEKTDRGAGGSPSPPNGWSPRRPR